MILERADTVVAEYNRVGRRYNRVVDAIYKARETSGPFSAEYEPHIIAGLISFDMGRTMGAGDKYEFTGTGFRARLRAKMHIVRERLKGVPLVCPDQTELASFQNAITEAYDCLAASGEGALRGNQYRQFHVGATKILHWIAPALFIVLDRNVASAFRRHHHMEFASGDTQKRPLRVT